MGRARDDDTKDKIKRLRRIRGGRRLPRSGAGVHEETRSKKLSDAAEEDLDDELRRYRKGEYDDDDELGFDDVDDGYDNYLNTELTKKELENKDEAN